MPTNKIILDLNDIKKLIPHREPFLFVDRVEDIIKNVSATGIKDVSVDEYFFKGHFPNFPIMPGVLIIEALAQTAACLVSYSNTDLQEEKVVFLTSIDNAKFKKVTTPGNVLKLKVEMKTFRQNFFKFSGTALTDDDIMVIASFSAMIKGK
tara:strand:- start:169 stop:621 length:453 start_codon:yes stop_codon:yes gene_type:complete